MGIGGVGARSGEALTNGFVEFHRGQMKVLKEAEIEFVVQRVLKREMWGSFANRLQLSRRGDEPESSFRASSLLPARRASQRRWSSTRRRAEERQALMAQLRLHSTLHHPGTKQATHSHIRSAFD